MTETKYNTHHSHYSIRFAQSNAVEPCIDPTMAAWDLLTDFENWPSWIPTLLKVERLDPGDPGRGSVLSLDYGNRSEQWTIQYWKPLTRIDFINNSNGARIACSYSMATTHDNSQLDIELESGSAILHWLLHTSPVLTIELVCHDSEAVAHHSSQWPIYSPVAWRRPLRAIGQMLSRPHDRVFLRWKYQHRKKLLLLHHPEYPLLPEYF